MKIKVRLKVTVAGDEGKQILWHAKLILSSFYFISSYHFPFTT